MKLIVTLLLAAAPLWAAAQTDTVWRCGADGRSYSSTPCAGGRQIEAPAARPDADLQDAQERAQREQRLADKLQKERQHIEAQARGNGLAGITGARREAATSTAKAAARHKPKLRRHAPADADTWRAAAPASPRAPG